jgi:hypothetical protein
MSDLARFIDITSEDMVTHIDLMVAQKLLTEELKQFNGHPKLIS